MTNAEIIKALRYCADGNNICTEIQNCGYYGKGFFCQDTMMLDAADALEADDEKIADCVAAIDALDDSNDAYIKENERLKKRIAELEAQMPKEGEWVWDDDGMDFNIGSWRCGRCRERPNTYWQGEKDVNPLRFAGSHYCPNCGAMMRKGEHDGES